MFRNLVVFIRIYAPKNRRIRYAKRYPPAKKSSELYVWITLLIPSPAMIIMAIELMNSNNALVSVKLYPNSFTFEIFYSPLEYLFY